MSRNDVRSAAILVTLVLVARPATAQQGTAEIRGRVTDQQMGALPGVTVTVTNQESGNFREAASTPDGSWFMAALPPGRYQVAAQLDGFKKFVRRDVTLAVGNQLNVDVKLELGGIEEVVTVSGDSPIIDVTSKEIGGNITTKELSEITVDNKGGRNGAFGPGYMQLDTRVGWRIRAGQGKTLDLTADVINLTNRANFVNPTSDRRSTNFLLLTTLYGGGQPRQAQIGFRFGF